MIVDSNRFVEELNSFFEKISADVSEGDFSVCLEDLTLLKVLIVDFEKIGLTFTVEKLKFYSNGLCQELIVKAIKKHDNIFADNFGKLLYKS